MNGSEVVAAFECVGDLQDAILIDVQRDDFDTIAHAGNKTFEVVNTRVDKQQFGRGRHVRDRRAVRIRDRPF